MVGSISRALMPLCLAVAESVALREHITGCYGSQPAHLVGESGIVSSHSAAISNGSKVLCRVKTKGGTAPDAAHGLAVVHCTVRLRAVLQKDEIVSVAQAAQLVHLSGMSVEVNGKDGFELRPHRRMNHLIQAFRKHGEGDRVHIHK